MFHFQEKKNHKGYKEESVIHLRKQKGDIMCTSGSTDMKLTRRRLGNNGLKDNSQRAKRIYGHRATLYEQNADVNKKIKIRKRTQRACLELKYKSRKENHAVCVGSKADLSRQKKNRQTRIEEMEITQSWERKDVY